MKGNILFQEKQKFTQWWLWGILLAPTFYILFKLFIPWPVHTGESARKVSKSLIMTNDSWAALVILFVILLFVFFMTMSTTVDDRKIVVKHLYIVKKAWNWSEIESAEIISYGFVGYGIRVSLHNGMVYNVKGNKGLAIRFKNGKKCLIGTQRPEELAVLVNSKMS